MKPIRITADNVGALDKAIRDAEGNATARTMSAGDCIAAVGEAAEHPAMRWLPQKEQEGARALYEQSTNIASSCNGVPYATRIIIERRATGWFLIKVERWGCRKKQPGGITLCLTEQQSAQATRRFRATYITVPGRWHDSRSTD